MINFDLSLCTQSPHNLEIPSWAHNLLKLSRSLQKLLKNQLKLQQNKKQQINKKIKKKSYCDRKIVQSIKLLQQPNQIIIHAYVVV